jgi:hypothetical protein
MGMNGHVLVYLYYMHLELGTFSNESMTAFGRPVRERRERQERARRRREKATRNGASQRTNLRL